MCLEWFNGFVSWVDTHNGLAMVIVTFIYAVITLFMLRSNNKMHRTAISQKEQERVVASLPLIKELNMIFLDTPLSQKEAAEKRSSLRKLEGEIAALGGVVAYKCYADLSAFLKELEESDNIGSFYDPTIMKYLNTLYLKLSECFSSEAVAPQKVINRKRNFFIRLFTKNKPLELPVVKIAFQSSWKADSSSTGKLEIPNAKGQSDVTAMIIQDYFGGDICYITVNNQKHYFNVVEKQIVDVAIEKLEGGYDYKNVQTVDRKDFDETVQKRYGLLKARTDRHLFICGVLKYKNADQ